MAGNDEPIGNDGIIDANEVIVVENVDPFGNIVENNDEERNANNEDRTDGSADNFAQPTNAAEEENNVDRLNIPLGNHIHADDAAIDENEVSIENSGEIKVEPLSLDELGTENIGELQQLLNEVEASASNFDDLPADKADTATIAATTTETPSTSDSIGVATTSSAANEADTARNSIGVATICTSTTETATAHESAAHGADKIAQEVIMLLEDGQDFPVPFDEPVYGLVKHEKDRFSGNAAYREVVCIHFTFIVPLLK